MSTTDRGPGSMEKGSVGDIAQVEDNILMADSTSNEVETSNVIDQREDLNGPSNSNPEQPTTSQPMTEVISLSDLSFHSPSSQLLGTPFTTDSESRFEYPFPDSSSASDAPSPPSSANLSPSFPSLSTSASFPRSSSPSLVLSSSPSGMIVTFPPTFPLPADMPSYSLTHPKLRPANPPVPPGLVKKRQRWSLGLLRRRSGSGGQGSPSSESSIRTAPLPTAGSSDGVRLVRVSSDPKLRQATLQEDVAGTPSPPLTNTQIGKVRD